jgi:hypothetical protein
LARRASDERTGTEVAVLGLKTSQTAWEAAVCEYASSIGQVSAWANSENSSNQLHVERPHEPIGIAPYRLALDDEGIAPDAELIVGAWAGDVARPQLEGRGFGMDARVAEADDRVRAARDDPHRHRLTASQRVDGIDPECGERRVHRARLLLMSTRGRVQIGSGLNYTCSITQRANC